ncbi:hypothetical protein [Novosphingopyxis sp.]|uniref:hypothetical protein n=1 Tax=Novosphingopyxis sp. TaxID=2709690 RepID=UPI003B59ADB2
MHRIRLPHGAARRTLTDASDPEAPEPPAFDPVPMTRRRGWTAERQRAFVAALRNFGSVSRAARSVGLSRQTALQLRGRPGAESFAEAWDLALDMARGDASDIVHDIAIHGALEPLYYHGRLIGHRRRFDRRMLLGLLAAADRAEHRRGAPPSLSGPEGRVELSAKNYSLLRKIFS